MLKHHLHCMCALVRSEIKLTVSALLVHLHFQGIKAIGYKNVAKGFNSLVMKENGGLQFQTRPCRKQYIFKCKPLVKSAFQKKILFLN